MKKYNLSKIYNTSFKKDILDIIKQGMPEGGVYSSSEKPPEGAQVYRTDRGTEYWVPSKKDEPKQAERFPSKRKRVDKIKTPKKYLTCLINATLFRSIHHRQTKLSLP